jgi:cytochrome c peroxidase
MQLVLTTSHIAARVAAALLCVSACACSLHAQVPDIDAAWRAIFQRPVTPPAVPGGNASGEQIALGATLFADRRLSGNDQRSCATCHRPERAFTDGRVGSAALRGGSLRRNTPTLWNLAWSKQYFWDGRARSLEEQVRGPIEAADEMGGNWQAIVAKLATDDDLAARFRAAFPQHAPAISQATVVMALAAYVRSLVSPPTRFDAWIGGDAHALSAAEVRGFRLFTGKAGCVLCHAGWRFTDDRFHDIGLPSEDPGRSGLPDGTPGLKAFKTPTLREVARTAPYMHDGSLPTLAAVIKHYTGGFRARPSLAPSMKRDLKLTAQEKADLVAFLGTLSGPAGPR